MTMSMEMYQHFDPTEEVLLSLEGFEERYEKVRQIFSEECVKVAVRRRIARLNGYELRISYPDLRFFFTGPSGSGKDTCCAQFLDLVQKDLYLQSLQRLLWDIEQGILFAQYGQNHRDFSPSNIAAEMEREMILVMTPEQRYEHYPNFEVVEKAWKQKYQEVGDDLDIAKLSPRQKQLFFSQIQRKHADHTEQIFFLEVTKEAKKLNRNIYEHLQVIQGEYSLRSSWESEQKEASQVQIRQKYAPFAEAIWTNKLTGDIPTHRTIGALKSEEELKTIAKGSKKLKQGLLKEDFDRSTDRLTSTILEATEEDDSPQISAIQTSAATLVEKDGKFVGGNDRGVTTIIKLTQSDEKQRSSPVKLSTDRRKNLHRSPKISTKELEFYAPYGTSLPAELMPCEDKDLTVVVALIRSRELSEYVKENIRGKFKGATTLAEYDRIFEHIDINTFEQTDEEKFSAEDKRFLTMLGYAVNAVASADVGATNRSDTELEQVVHDHLFQTLPGKKVEFQFKQEIYYAYLQGLLGLSDDQFLMAENKLRKAEGDEKVIHSHRLLLAELSIFKDLFPELPFRILVEWANRLEPDDYQKVLDTTRLQYEKRLGQPWENRSWAKKKKKSIKRETQQTHIRRHRTHTTDTYMYLDYLVGKTGLSDGHQI